MRRAFTKAWQKTSVDIRKELLALADARDFGSIQDTLPQFNALAPTFLEALGTKPGAILSSALKSSDSFWLNHAATESGKAKSQVKRHKSKADETLADLAEAQVAAFIAQFPERIISPALRAEIDRMVANTYVTESDIILLKARLERIVDAADYMDGLSQVQVARLWQANGIQMANADGVKRLQIVEMVGDKRTCPVCVLAHGKEIDCSRAARQVEEGLRITDPDEYIAFWPFPRYPEVQQWSPQDWWSDGRFPPFHNRCRGQVRYLY